MTADTDIPVTTNLLGKIVTDLHESDVAVSNYAVTGTLKYVTGYTGFSGDVAEQSGNYLALKATRETGATVKVQFNGKESTLDADNLLILRITEANKDKVTFVSTNGTKTGSTTYDLSKLVLKEA